MPPSGRWWAKPGHSGERWGLNPDFRDLLSAFSAAEVRFLVVGAHAVTFHAVPRYKKDIDLWVEPTLENAKRAWEALARFGAPLEGVEVDDLLDSERACGRPQDLLDAEWLEKARQRR